jgi:hypothetical protein
MREERSFPPAHDILNAATTTNWRCMQLVVQVLFFCEIFVVLEPTVVVPLKESNLLFRDNQAGISPLKSDRRAPIFSLKSEECLLSKVLVRILVPVEYTNSPRQRARDGECRGSYQSLR